MTEGRDGLGGSWLGDERPPPDTVGLGEHLRQAIPTPAPSYWDTIDQSLRVIERDAGHNEEMETSDLPRRLTSMNPQDSLTNSRRSLPVLIAAAFLVVVGVLGVAVLNRGSDDALDVATAPVEASDPSAGTDTSGAEEAAGQPATQDPITPGEPEETQVAQPAVDSQDAPDETTPSAETDGIDELEDDTATGAQVVNADSVLSSAGLGPMQIGMTVSELSTAVGTELTIDTFDEPASGACGWIPNIDEVSDGLWVLVELTGSDSAILRRITATDPRWRTPSNISVGASEDEVRATFEGRLDVFDHVYVPEGSYLRFVPNDVNDPNTVQFDTDGSTVTDIHVGDRDWIGFVEGCA